MRVVAGEKKGHKLKTLKGLEVRPTLEQVKESIFNMLTPVIEGSTVADLFCGSGNLGIEALSRGAKKCYFIDYSRDALRITRENLLKLDLIERAEILKIKLPDAVERFENLKEVTLLLADPPYGTQLATKLLAKLAGTNLLRPDCLLVVEHSGKSRVGFDPKTYDLMKEKKFGQSEVLILRKK